MESSRVPFIINELNGIKSVHGLTLPDTGLSIYAIKSNATQDWFHYQLMCLLFSPLMYLQLQSQM